MRERKQETKREKKRKREMQQKQKTMRESVYYRRPSKRPNHTSREQEVAEEQQNRE